MIPLRKISLALTAACMLAGCAQTGPPLPPSLELPKPPSDLRAARKGNVVTLTWSEPTLTTDRQSVRYLGPTLICRTTEAEITACATPLAMLPPPASPAPAKHASHSASRQAVPEASTDALAASLFSDNPSSDITYAVEVLNRNARGAGLSNRVHVPAIRTLAPPFDLAVELNADGANLSWTSEAEVSQPGVSHRYRIYRRDEKTGKDAVAGEVPLSAAGPVHFLDAMEWEKSYFYRITAVSVIALPGKEVQVEGDDSPAVHLAAHDIFPPAVPAGLEAVYSGEGQKPFIDLIWSPVTTADLAGYNIYRSEAGGAPLKLNSDLVRTPSYRDTAVAAGKPYAYSVSAVDVRGNESAKSDEASETVPPSN
jgi:hypothetical protein